MESMIIATKNEGKVCEFKEILGNRFNFLSLNDFPHLPDIIETGDTFATNSYMKALFTARASGVPAIADDSGICVDSIGGAPGVYSARYAGDGATDGENILKLLNSIPPDTNRSAKFETVITIALPTGQSLSYTGECRGLIERKEKGSNGFGYDPIFYSLDLGMTFGEATKEQKNKVSHRSRALAKLLSDDKLDKWIRECKISFFIEEQARGLINLIKALNL